MSGMNFFRPPYEQATPQVKPYSFIDDLMGGIGHMTAQADQAKQQRDAMMQHFIDTIGTMSPEQYLANRNGNAGQMFPELFKNSYGPPSQPQGPPQAPMATSATPQQIQGAGAALTGQPMPQGPLAQGPVAPQPPASPAAAVGFPGMPLSVAPNPFAQVPVPEVAPPVPDTLTSAAGGVAPKLTLPTTPLPTQRDPMAGLPQKMDITQQKQLDLVNGGNPTADAAKAYITKFLADLDKPDAPNPLMDTTKIIPGRDWLLGQQGEKAKQDALTLKGQNAIMHNLVQAAVASGKDIKQIADIVHQFQTGAITEAGVMGRLQDVQAMNSSRAFISNNNNDKQAEQKALDDATKNHVAAQHALDSYLKSSTLRNQDPVGYQKALEHERNLSIEVSDRRNNLFPRK